MHSFRDYCIGILEPKLATMTAVDKFVLGRQFGVTSWFQESIYQLVTQQTLLTPTEAKRMRFETAFCIARIQARWMIRQEKGIHESSYSRSLSNEKEALHQTIKSCFRSELNEMGLDVTIARSDYFYGCVDDDDSFLSQELQLEKSIVKQEMGIHSSSRAPMKHQLHYYHSIVFLVGICIYWVRPSSLMR
jgi:hypothetical protein